MTFASQDPHTILRETVVRGFYAWANAMPAERLTGRYRTAELAIGSARDRAVRHWSTAETSVNAAEETISGVRHDQRLTPEAKAETIRNAIAERGGEAREAATELRTVVDGAADRLATVLLPARPQPADAAQEAALANVRTDTAMVLDRLAVNEVPQRLEAMVREAAGTGDDLARWFLLATPWPARYIESRGGEANIWTYSVPNLAREAADDPAEAQALHRVHDALTSPEGMLGAVSGLDHWIAKRLDALERAVIAV